MLVAGFEYREYDVGYGFQVRFTGISEDTPAGRGIGQRLIGGEEVCCKTANLVSELSDDENGPRLPRHEEVGWKK